MEVEIGDIYQQLLDGLIPSLGYKPRRELSGIPQRLW